MIYIYLRRQLINLTNIRAVKPEKEWCVLVYEDGAVIPVDATTDEIYTLLRACGHTVHNGKELISQYDLATVLSQISPEDQIWLASYNGEKK